MRFTTVIFIYVLLMMLSSCVGVIESGSNQKTNSTPATSNAKFDGIYDGFAIAHNKIIARFKPAQGGSGKFTYLAYLDGNYSLPAASVLGEKANIDNYGYINLEIANLEYNTSYLINIYVQDITTQKIVISSKAITVWTLEDYVPDFKGINKIENVAGVDGMTSLRIKWNVANSPSITGEDAFNPIHAPSGYNIYYSSNKAELEKVLALEDQHSPILTPYPNSKVVNVASASDTEKIITGLTKGREYFVTVRARQSSTPPIYERNLKILAATTYSEAPVTFNGIKTATRPIGVTGFSQINVTWDACTGCGLYKIFVKPSDVDNGSIHPITDASYLVSTITNLNLTSATLVNGSLITANKNYKAYILACKDADCGWSGSSFNDREIQGRYTSASVTTTPPIAPFSESQPDDMIISVTQPSGIAGLEQLNIKWAPIDTTQGYFSKVRIYHVLNKLGDIYTISGNANLVQLGTNAAVPFGTPYIHPSSPSLEAANNPIQVTVANLDRDTEYCFIVLPWITGNGLTASQEVTLATSQRPSVKCGQTSYIAPDFGSTSLFPVCTPQSGGTNALIEWTPPEEMNIFTHYEIYFRKSDGSFDFSGANGAWLNGLGIYGQDPDYPKVDYLRTSQTITHLIPNTEYHFGMNTYYLPQGEITPIRQYPIGQSIVTCQTTNANVLHGGWKHVQAVGPKINGQTLAVVPEILREDQFRVLSPDAVNGSSTGIVRVQWYDFEIPGTNLRIKDYDDPNNSGIGYHVYRFKVTDDVDKADMKDPENPKWGNPLFTTKLKFDLVSNGNGKFAYSSDTINADPASVYLIPASYSRSISGDNIYEFVDYPPSKQSLYYYKVVAVFNNQEAEFDDPSHPTNVLSVFVPANNEAFIHRWIANLSLCEKMGRGIGSLCTDLLGRCADTENNYRCEYDGIGGTLDTGVKYLDIGKHVVMDRFENGINYTKGKCTVNGVDNQDCINRTGSVIAHSPSYTADLIVTTNAIDTRPLAKLNSADVFKLPTYVTGYLTAGSGVAKNFFTNNAYMPAANSDVATSYQFACKERDRIEFYSGDGMSSAKRLMKAREFIVGAQYESVISATDRRKVNEATNTLSHVHHKDCNTNYQAMWNHANYNSNFASKVLCINPSVSCLMLTGTDGDYSTENCQSRFGIQDMVGNGWEQTSGMIDRTTGIGKTSTIDPSNAELTDLRFDASTMDGTTNNSFSIFTSSSYVNQIYYLPLNCSGVNGYSSNPALAGYHQCGPDDKLAKNLEVLSTARMYNFYTVGMPHAKDRGMWYGGTWTTGVNANEMLGAFSTAFDTANNGFTFRCAYDITE